MVLPYSSLISEIGIGLSPEIIPIEFITDDQRGEMAQTAADPAFNFSAKFFNVILLWYYGAGCNFVRQPDSHLVVFESTFGV